MKEVKNYLDSLTKTLDLIDQNEIYKLRDKFIETRDKGGQIFVFGNGGSGSTASHMVCDILKGCSYGHEKKYKILCLNDNIPTILAYANDISYDEVFLEQLKNYANSGDLVIGISGSGNSINVLKAIKFANEINCETASLTGFNGGNLNLLTSIKLNVPVSDMQITEDAHVIIMHILYKLLNNSND